VELEKTPDLFAQLRCDILLVGHLVRTWNPGSMLGYSTSFSDPVCQQPIHAELAILEALHRARAFVLCRRD